jgi:hypothetical protein
MWSNRNFSFYLAIRSPLSENLETSLPVINAGGFSNRGNGNQVIRDGVRFTIEQQK